MTLDLNKKYVTKNGLLKFLKDIDVYQFYTEKEVDLANSILSPLRDEQRPSFKYFVGQSGEICFNDFVLGTGDFIDFVQLRFGLTFFEALSKIAIDFNIDNRFIVKKVAKTEKNYDPKKFENRDVILSTANKSRLGKNSRKWNLADLAFWLQFGISIETLRKYNVEPISHIYINGNPIVADKYAYCFKEFKDGKETIKVYQPFSEKFKWLNNHDESIWQGWEQLPAKGHTLIITKSLKDVMAVTEVLGFPSVSLQAESVKPKQKIIDELKSRFEYVYLLYDNDFDKKINYGRKFGEALANEFHLLQIEIPDLFKSKDFSDLIKNHSSKVARDIWEVEWWVPF
tara:strand:- start:54520 stop:55545 length:1026 start_codon:yes stop_codon:yes gene_type:complete